MHQSLFTSSELLSSILSSSVFFSPISFSSFNHPPIVLLSSSLSPPLFLLHHRLPPLTLHLLLPSYSIHSSSSSLSSSSFPRGEPMCASCCSKGSNGVDRNSLAGIYSVCHTHTHTHVPSRHCRCCIKINEPSLANQVSQWEGNGILWSAISWWRSSL